MSEQCCRFDRLDCTLCTAHTLADETGSRTMSGHNGSWTMTLHCILYTKLYQSGTDVCRLACDSYRAGCALLSAALCMTSQSRQITTSCGRYEAAHHRWCTCPTHRMLLMVTPSRDFVPVDMLLFVIGKAQLCEPLSCVTRSWRGRLAVFGTTESSQVQPTEVCA